MNPKICIWQCSSRCSHVSRPITSIITSYIYLSHCIACRSTNITNTNINIYNTVIKISNLNSLNTWAQTISCSCSLSIRPIICIRRSTARCSNCCFSITDSASSINYRWGSGDFCRRTNSYCFEGNTSFRIGNLIYINLRWSIC